LPINYKGTVMRKTLGITDGSGNPQPPMTRGLRPRPAAPATAKAGSFSQAFAKARAAGEKTFTWNGKQYTTQLKGESTAKPQTRDTTPVQMIPPKVVTSFSNPYFESPTGKQVPAMAKTSYPAAQSAIEKSKASTPTAQSTQYFKPGTMADYLEERRRKMQGNLMTKR